MKRLEFFSKVEQPNRRVIRRAKDMSLAELFVLLLGHPNASPFPFDKGDPASEGFVFLSKLENLRERTYEDKLPSDLPNEREIREAVQIFLDQARQRGVTAGTYKMAWTLNSILTRRLNKSQAAVSAPQAATAP